MIEAAAPGPALFTDLYELKMLQAYRRERMAGIAVFDLFVRSLPPGRGFLLAAGIEDALDYLEQLRFRPDELDYLAGLAISHPSSSLRSPLSASPAGCVRWPRARRCFPTSRCSR